MRLRKRIAAAVLAAAAIIGLPACSMTNTMFGSNEVLNTREVSGEVVYIGSYDGYYYDFRLRDDMVMYRCDTAREPLCASLNYGQKIVFDAGHYTGGNDYYPARDNEVASIKSVDDQ